GRPLRGGPPRPRAAVRARAPLHAGGRVPPPHGPEPGGLMATTTTVALRARPAPPQVPGWRAVAEHWMRKYRRVWFGTAISSFLAPLLYRAGMGFGLGLLVDRASGGVGGVPYVVFIAPGVLASTAMQVGVGEASFSVMGGIKWDRIYHGMLATP